MSAAEVVEVIGPPPPGASEPATTRSRRRAWLLAAAVALLVLIYLTAWSGYAAVHTADRYRQLAPGAAGSRTGAEVRLLSLVSTERLVAREQQDPQVADAGAVFVVAQLELVQQQPEEFVSCSDADLLGPGGRRWESISTDVLRQVPYCDSSDIVVGQPYRFESVYLVPQRYIDGVVGVALVDRSAPRRTPVLRPPA